MTIDHPPGTWVTDVHQDILALSFRTEKSLFSGQSPFQKIEILQTAGHGRMLLNDNIIMLSERDEFIYHEMIAHVPLFVHPKPERVLIIGGGDGGTLREVIKHPGVRRVVMVEIDRMVVDACRAHLPSVAGGFDDPRLELRIADGVRYVAETQERFDVVIVDSTDPIGPAMPLFTRTFYENTAAILEEDGILVTQSESPYYDHALQMPLLSNQRPFFRRLHIYLIANMTYPGGFWSLGFASKRCCPLNDFDPERVAASGITFQYYNADIHRASFALPTFVAARLGGVLDPVPAAPEPRRTAAPEGGMRRKEKQITDRAEIEAIIAKAKVCRLALCSDGRPYVVPLCFGYLDNTLYFHSAPQGKKIEMLAHNNRVCFELDVDCNLKTGGEPCEWGMRYRSVIGSGKAVVVNEASEKRRALGVIMGQYAPAGAPFAFPEAKLRATVVIRVDIHEMTGKRS